MTHKFIFSTVISAFYSLWLQTRPFRVEYLTNEGRGAFDLPPENSTI